MLTPAPDNLPPIPEARRYFFVQKYSFAAIGIDPTSAERTIFNQYLVWIPNAALLLVCFPMALYATQHTDDMNLVTDAMAPVWQASLGAMKLILFIWQRKTIVQLVRKIWQWNLIATGDELQIIIDENRADSLFSMFFYSCVFFTAILALSAPFVIALYYTWMGDGFWDSLQPPLKGDYMIDVKGSYLAYAFAFVWDAVAVYAVLNTSLSIDTLFSWIMHNISAHFSILNLRFKSLATDTPADKFQKSLVHCVHYHRHIIEVAKTFNDVYMMTVFVKFAISFLQLAFLVFQFARGGELAGQIFHLSFFISVSMQLMLYCYGGQRLADQSTSVAVAIYEHFQWQDLSVKSKKLLLMPLMRAQKPCFMTGVFFVADLNLFLWVFKTAGSIITMLMSMADNYLMDAKGSYLAYAFIFLFDAVAIYGVLNSSLSTDTLFSWIMHNISAHFRILNLRFKSLASIGATPDGGAAGNEEFRKSLIHCVHYHRHIIEAAGTFNDVFMLTVFIKFAISFLQLAFLVFQFARGGELAGQIFHLSFFFSVSMQLMLYCYGGQRITDESLSVGVAIYEHFHWQDLSVKAKKLLLLPLMRSQKPCYLSGIFFVLDLNLYVWVFKTAGSIITMLMSLDKKE